MKAFLLGAGVGSRLRPLTDHTPKCLVPVGGQPILSIWFDALLRHGVTEVLLNTHHLAEAVRAFVRDHTPPGLRVTLFHEERLLGSAGTVAANRDFVAGEDAFLVVYADNLTDVDLSDLLRFHRARRSPFTLALFRSPEPRECGIASLDADGRVTAFVEKPRQPDGNLANAGLYVAGQDVFGLIPDKPVADFGFDVLPLLVGKMFGYTIPGFFCDLGTPERLERARRDWPGARGDGEKRAGSTC